MNSDAKIAVLVNEVRRVCACMLEAMGTLGPDQVAVMLPLVQAALEDGSAPTRTNAICTAIASCARTMGSSDDWIAMSNSAFLASELACWEVEKKGVTAS